MPLSIYKEMVESCPFREREKGEDLLTFPIPATNRVRNKESGKGEEFDGCWEFVVVVKFWSFY
ncbi:hypothetical protein V2J09_003589 [Rumex salicifolius]